MLIENRQNFPEFLNGERIIQIVNARKEGILDSRTFQGILDNTEYIFNRKSSEYHLGLLQTWGMQSKERVSMIAKVLERGSEILVDGFFGSFTYDKAFFEPKKGFRTVRSTADEVGPRPGIDETPFHIVLSQRCYPGDILAADLYGDERQLYVIDCEASELNGEGWRTVVQLTSADPSDYYNPALLESDITYTKLDHIGVEHTDRFTGVDGFDANPTGYVRAEIRLGGIRGVEGMVTGFADALTLTSAKNSQMATANYDTSVEKAMREFQAKYAGGDSDATTVIYGDDRKSEKTGKADPSKIKATSLMEFLVERTLARRTESSHMWNKQGQIRNVNGAIGYISEGVYHQMKRGKVITFPKYMGITKAHILEAVEYLFKNNPDLDWQEREVVFEVGSLAEKNMLLIFQDEVKQQLSALQANGQLMSFLFGNDGVLSDKLKNGLVTGSSLNELELSSFVRFTSVTLMGIAGKVSFKVNKSFDNRFGNPVEFRGMFENGKDWTSHSMIIWDVTKSEYSNNIKGITGGTNVSGGDVKINHNLYLVRPKQGMTYKGHSNGRWDRGKTEGIISSHSYIGQEFWAFNSSRMWIPYPDRCIIIEMSPGARRIGRFGNNM